MEISWQNYWIVLLLSIQMCKLTPWQVRLSGAYIFQDQKVIFKHFSRKISHFQGRLKNQALFKTAFKFKHFSRSVGTMTDNIMAVDDLATQGAREKQQWYNHSDTLLISDFSLRRVNSLAPRKCNSYFKIIIFEHSFMLYITRALLLKMNREVILTIMLMVSQQMSL